MPTRVSFRHELDQLGLQVEVMAFRVSEALAATHEVLRTGDLALASRTLAADDQIDAMLVSLTERTYDLIRRESPVASDLRYLVSVLRVVEELERIGDLALRVVKQAHEQPVLASHPRLFTILDDMASAAEVLFHTAFGAWAARDPMVAGGLGRDSARMDDAYRGLLDEILGLDGEGVVPVVVTAVLVGRAFERIADHTVIVGERLRYLLTGDPAFLASEVR